MIKLHSAKKRSRRLEKKLRVGEFKGLYVSIDITYNSIDELVSDGAFERADAICDVLEWFGGFCCTTERWLAHAGCDYYARYGSDIPREIATKLFALDFVKSVTVSEPVDANYDILWDADISYDIDGDLMARPGTITIP